MKTRKDLKAMDGMESCELGSKISDVANDMFMQKIAMDGAKDKLQEIYRQYKDKISRVEFNESVESAIKATIDSYRMLIDDIEGAEDVIKV